jgi:hypothetical protein
MNAKECLKQLKTFNPPKEKKPKDKLALPKMPTKPIEVEMQLAEYKEYLINYASSPFKPKLQSFVQGAKQVLVQAQLIEHELAIVQTKRVEDLERKVTKRKVLQKSGGLTADDAQRKIDALNKKAEDAEQKRQRAVFLKQWRADRDQAYREGVKARARERARVKAVKELLKAKQDIPPELLDPIPDPEAIWKAGQEEIKIQEALLQQQQQEEQDGEVTIVVDTAGD